MMAQGFGNLETVIQQLIDYGEGFVDGVLQAQLEVGKDVLERSQTYVPVDTGALKSTGLLTADLENIHLTSVDIQYGGPAAPYAVYVHEDLTKYHQAPTQAKFLERAVDELAPTMTVRIGEGAVAAAKARAG